MNPPVEEGGGLAGMTLLDYFAAHAPPVIVHKVNFSDIPGVLAEIVAWNYAYAHAMLAERAK